VRDRDRGHVRADEIGALQLLLGGRLPREHGVHRRPGKFRRLAPQEVAKLRAAAK